MLLLIRVKLCFLKSKIMIISKITKDLNFPQIEENKPSKKEFLSLIETAQKADHQIYTEKKLTPFYFDTNANLPSIFNLISSPFDIISTIIHIPKEKLKKISISLEEAHCKILSQAINFLSAGITPLLYLTTFFGLAIKTTISVPLILGLGFATSVIEIIINSAHLHEQNKFLKTFNIKALKIFSNATTSFSKESLKKSISLLIAEVSKDNTFNDSDYGKNLVDVLTKMKQSIKADPNRPLAEIRDDLRLLLNTFRKEFVEIKIKSLEKKFFSINEARKEKTQSSCEEYYEKHSYSEALYHGCSLVQDLFRAKKVHLANRVQPWLALEMIQTHQEILKNLKSKTRKTQELGIESGLALLERAQYNASIKKQVHITNIVLFGVTLLSYALSVIFPVIAAIPIVSFITSFSVYYFNSFRINGILNSKSYTVDWKNCCPSWMITLAEKIHSLKTKHYPSVNKNDSQHPIPYAVNITSSTKR